VYKSPAPGTAYAKYKVPSTSHTSAPTGTLLSSIASKLFGVNVLSSSGCPSPPLSPLSPLSPVFSESVTISSTISSSLLLFSNPSDTLLFI